MTTTRLGELLDDLASSVAPPQLADRAWSAGRRRRRQHRAAAATAGSAVLVVAVLAGAGLIAPDGRDRPRPANTPTASASPAAPAPAAAVARLSDGGIIQVAPPKSAEAALPWTDSALPHLIDVLAAAPTLAADPPTRAIALFQSSSPGIRVLGADGRLRSLGVQLADTHDASGNSTQPLRATSLRADGMFAAFPQPDAVIVVTIATGKSRKFPVPGLNEDLRWHPDGSTLIVWGADQTVLLDMRTGKIGRTSVSGPDMVVRPPGGEVIEVRSGRTAGQIRSFVDVTGGACTSRCHPTQATDPALREWYGSPWVSGDRVARSAFNVAVTRPIPGIALLNPEAVAAIDIATGRTVRLLAFDLVNRNKGCCTTLGWADDNTVVLTSAGEGTYRLLAWNVTTGSLTKLTELSGPATISLTQPLSG